ncbi:Somatostatin receptor type 4 [Acropora cervicornis]|uniref:Somatostatin receptor type 4 n=1 Tax=Acropora cervicornis TaxID=6130 RepID=A0AAD9UT55_ACRCE|nr:Somatostatin receptor type 4 [Acropora cervicornis]
MLTLLNVILLTIKSIIFLASIAGNFLVGFVVLRNRDMRTPFNYLLVNLAAADIVYPSFLLSHYMASLTIETADEMPGNAICMSLSKAAWVGAFAGVFTMIVVARERYYTVVNPHGIKGKLTIQSVKIIIPSSWFLSVLINIRGFVLQGIGNEIAVKSCDHHWTNKTLELAYQLIWLVLLCISLLLMQGVLKVRKRVTLMVLIVSAMFEICWITDTILHAIVVDFRSAEISIVHAVIMLNSAINPFVYALLSQRFRQKMKRTIRFWSPSSERTVAPEESSYQLKRLPATPSTPEKK